MTRTVAAALAAAGVFAAAAGCGAGTTDLMALEVTGGYGHHLTRIRVTDDGRASCNGSRLREISNKTLLDAREVKRRLRPYARRGVTFGPTRVGRQYLFRSFDGTVRWDLGAGGPRVLAQAALLELRLERTLCRH